MSTHQQPPSQPEIPAELWMLWWPDDASWLSDSEYDPPFNGRLAYFSQLDADIAAERYAAHHEIRTTPVRVK